MRFILFLFLLSFNFSFANMSTNSSNAFTVNHKLSEKLQKIDNSHLSGKNNPQRGKLIFDMPVTYNTKVSKWISYYQGRGSKWFREWVERSYKFLPMIQTELKKHGLPTDLAYMAMIESGFSSHAASTSEAVGPWQFIESTAKRYGLTVAWWLDERKDMQKSTLAAIRYIKDLYKEFGSWYLVAASYNMGENGLRRKIEKYRTNDYWKLIKLGALPDETEEYVPKILAAMLITKAPSLYGFRGLEKPRALSYEFQEVTGGTDLNDIADRIGVTRKSLRDLNAELLLGYVPKQLNSYMIRVPIGSGRLVGQMFNKNKILAKEDSGYSFQ